MEVAKTWGWLGLAALIPYLAFTAVGIHLDPPTSLPWLPNDFAEELFIEAPAKAHEARNWALFDTWHRNPADQYQFWRVQSPLWVYPLAGAFRAFGTTYETLRTFSVIHGIAGLLGFLVFAKKGMPTWSAAVAAWLLATSVYVTQLGRSGLVEIGLAAWIAWMMVALRLADRHPGWLVAAQAFFTAAFLQKAGAVYTFPVLVGISAWTFWQWRRELRFPRLRWLPVVTATLLTVTAAAYVALPDYQRVIGWTYDRLVSIDGSELARATRTPVANYGRFHPMRLVLADAGMLPGIGILALPLTLWLGARVWRNRFQDRFETVLAAWSAITWAMILVVGEYKFRYASLVFLPSYLLIGFGLSRITASVRAESAQRTRWAIGVAVGGTLAWSLVQQRDALTALDGGVEDCVTLVEQRVGNSEAVIVGRSVMPILLATPYDLYYVKTGFNTAPATIRALGITHALYRTKKADWARGFLERADSRFRRGKKLGSCGVQGYRLDLIQFPAAS